jgi:hypothetical protein
VKREGCEEEAATVLLLVLLPLAALVWLSCSCGVHLNIYCNGVLYMCESKIRMEKEACVRLGD